MKGFTWLVAQNRRLVNPSGVILAASEIILAQSWTAFTDNSLAWVGEST